MKEIEVKARLVDRDKIVKKLESLGCVLGEPVTQMETVGHLTYTYIFD